MTQENTYYGKYRGTVVNNVDPEKRGRVQVTVPDVKGVIPSTWAMPCVPVLGMGMGMYSVPPIGAGVWIEFEHGNPDYPIWTGCYADSALDVPMAGQMIIPPVSGVTIQTMLQNSLVVSDLPPSPVTGGIVLKSLTGAMIVVNDSGIYISNGKGASIIMVGPTVTINNGALTVV
jgi:hypothetical protein